MVNQVYSPGLFITTSKNVVEKIVGSNVQTIDKALSLLSPDERLTILVSPNSNNNGVLSAKISWKAVEAGDEFGTLKLRVVETGESFERFIDSINYMSFILGNGAKDINSVKDAFESLAFTVYVSIGVGNNIKNWSPFVGYTLYQNNINFDEAGNKLIDLAFNVAGSPMSRINSIAKGVANFASERGISLDLFNYSLGSEVVIESGEFEFEYEDQESLKTSTINAIKSYLSKWFTIKTDQVTIAIPKDFNGILPSIPGFQSNLSDFKKAFELAHGSTNPNKSGTTDPKSIKRKLKISSSGLSNPNSDSNSKISKLPIPYIPLKGFSDFISKQYLENRIESEYIIHVETNVEVLNLMKKHFVISPSVEGMAVFFCPAYLLKKMYLTMVQSLDNVYDLDFEKNILLTLGDDGDFVDLTNKLSYFYEFYVNFIKANLKSSFEVVNETIDILSVDESVEKTKELLDFDGIVFTHNTKNSNVVSIDYTIDTLSLLYNVGIKDTIEQLAVGYFNQKNIEEFLDKELTYKLNNIKEIISKFYGGKTDNIKSILLDPEAYNDFIKLYIKDLQKNNYSVSESRVRAQTLLDDFQYLSSKFGVDGLLLLIDKLYNPTTTVLKVKVEDPSKAIDYSMKYSELIRKLSIQLTLKTLPFFSLTQANALRRNCVFFSYKNRVIGTDTKINSLNPFSDSYIIIGFEHVIENNECYSTFDLQKSPGYETINIIPKIELPLDADPILEVEVDKLKDKAALIPSSFNSGSTF